MAFSGRAVAKSSPPSLSQYEEPELSAPLQPLLFETMYKRHLDSVYRFCLWQLKDRSAAEDITSEVFVSAYRAYRRAPPNPGELRPWLFRIARNAIIDHHRRDKRWQGVLSVLQRNRSVESTAPPPPEQDDEMARVFSGIESLRPRERLLVSLHYAADMAFGDIARMTGISEGAAARATYRAVAKIRDSVERSKNARA